MGRVFLTFHHTVPLQHRDIIGTKRIGNVLGKNLMIGMADNLIRGEVKKLFKPSIGQEIPAIRVFDVDHRRRVVGHVLE